MGSNIIILGRKDILSLFCYILKHVAVTMRSTHRNVKAGRRQAKLRNDIPLEAEVGLAGGAWALVWFGDRDERREEGN